MLMTSFKWPTVTVFVHGISASDEYHNIAVGNGINHGIDRSFALARQPTTLYGEKNLRSIPQPTISPFSGHQHHKASPYLFGSKSPSPPILALHDSLLAGGLIPSVPHQPTAQKPRCAFLCRRSTLVNRNRRTRWHARAGKEQMLYVPKGRTEGAE